MSKDVKQSTVDRMTERGVQSGLTLEKAKQVARESAERVNRQRQQAR